VVGSGTDFDADFNLRSVFVANNEYFRVSSISNTTYMVTDRLPANAFSGVVAYKQTSTLEPFDSINITFDNQTFTFDQG